MKQIVCEMCASTKLQKEDGVFVCQNCGCQYSVEEAKKLMVEIEGTVDVSGSTIKVDNTAFVEKYLANARRAKEKEDWEETEKYYNMVEQNDPSNIEAIFYSSYGRVRQSLVDSDLYQRQAAFKVLQNCVSLIDDNFDIDKEADERNTINQISVDIFDLVTSTYVYHESKNGYGITIRTDKMQTITLFNTLQVEFVNTIEHIIAKFPDGDNRRAFYYELALNQAEYVLKCGSLANPTIVQNHIMELHRGWNKIDASHEVPEKAPSAGAKQSGCYVATAVYGSYDCPEVWTLRRYRDYSLSGTWCGRIFIKTYYAISPTLVKWFGDTNWFKKMWRGTLDNLVANLQDKGFESTPYEDMDWEK